MNICNHCHIEITDENRSPEKNECEPCFKAWESLEEGPPIN